MEPQQLTWQDIQRYYTVASRYFRKYWRIIAAVGVCVVVGGAGFLGRHVLVNAAQNVFTQKVVEQETVVEVPSSTLEERLAEVLSTTATLQQQLQENKLEQRSLKEAFEHAIAEVAAENDLLTAQAQKLTAALAAVPGATSKSSQSSDVGKTTGQPAVTGKVNINTAAVAELDSLPGIGPSYAERIIAYRKEHGNFTSPEDIQNVTGIGPATYAKIAGLITI
ncbi:hypothetical protein BH11PAT4_BH11PAT4_4570 [soil metagenome]